ncbi:glycosyltransferase family 4 protein [Noviherbaspirillum denitrificans]|uniref:Glycosyl transferase family 1 n=1 Tax=Noviherbaspirillum denitrificans TaxID=1968433 RepID=A0A254TAV6_9BURK|nr:glycosyltransferase family 1 protein [Noviherbaspirillum denitrificans]OWW19781.1 glycosyl transferase family 1 [Noviherbaspirillum denitrificans]
MRKIALISEHASPLALIGSTDSGGQNVYVAQIARQLARLGYLVDIFTRRDSEFQEQVVDWVPGVRVIHVPAGPAHFVPKEAMLPFMEQFGRFVIRFARRQKLPYDLMHANFFMSGMVARQVRKSLGIPFVMTFHALGRVRRLNQKEADAFPDIRFAIEERLMQEADRIIAECPQDQADMEQLYGAPTERIDIVPCGFDPDEFWPVTLDARQQLGLGQDEFILLQLGRMVPRKGVDNVIRALAILKHQYQVRARLLVVGGNAEQPDPIATPELGRLMALAQTLDVEDAVTFTGQRRREQLRYYYSAANVFVTTPWYEPFGITPVEAMACGTPVVGTAVGGIKTTVVDGETGCLVPPNDPEALAEKLVWLQRHPHIAQRMGWAGMRRAYQHFTWRNVATHIAAVYESVLEPATAYVMQPLAASGEVSLRS